MSLRFSESNWLEIVSIKLETIQEKLKGRDRRAIDLYYYKNLAKKIHRHSKHCMKCEHIMKGVFSENLEGLEKRAIEGRIRLYRRWFREKFSPIAQHLHYEHQYKFSGVNRVRFILLSILINIILASINYFMPFGWHWFFALIQLIIFWFIGYIMDKKNLLKGIRMDSFLPAPENWGRR